MNMKSLTIYALPGAVFLALASVNFAQNPGGSGPAPTPPKREAGPRPGNHPPPPPPPIMAVLDTDGDGALSAAEIAAASKSLLKLDANHDGSLSRDEMRPPRPDGKDCPPPPPPRGLEYDDEQDPAAPPR